MQKLKVDFKNWAFIVIIWSSQLLFVGCQRRKPQHVSIIPLPQSLQWTAEAFDLQKCHTIMMMTPSLKKEAKLLQQQLANRGIKVKLANATSSEKYTIQLNLDTIEADYLSNEAYRLQVKNELISLTANTKHGIFNGLQTLAQLLDSGPLVNGCNILDFPAYRWRGYMIDVGRNYQSIDLLKQQIDQMARYKLNVFHFHLTEDAAWRLQVKQYPQLTEAKFMQRN